MSINGNNRLIFDLKWDWSWYTYYIITIWYKKSSYKLKKINWILLFRSLNILISNINNISKIIEIDDGALELKN